MPPNQQAKRVKATVLRRFLAERWLARNVEKPDVAICFGNLPPLFKLRGHVIVFLQNRYLIDGVKLHQFPLKARLRLMVERLWFAARMSNVDEFVVQTPTMKRLLEARTRVSVRMLPFMDPPVEYGRRSSDKAVDKADQFDFIYVASGDPHKNHRLLIEAWCLLAEECLYPSLVLTLDEAACQELSEWMNGKIAQYKLRIKNMGSLPHERVLELYTQARALIYPSTIESFGMPLVEARQAGLPILAAELDYVRDVIDPEESFDPLSAVSILRAVKRYLGIDESVLPLCDAAGFLKHMLERTERDAPTRC